MVTKLSNLSQRYVRVREEGRQEDFMIKTIIKEIIKIDIDQIVEVGEYHLVVEYNMDRIIEIAPGIIRTIEMTLEKEIIEGI